MGGVGLPHNHPHGEMEIVPRQFKNRAFEGVPKLPLALMERFPETAVGRAGDASGISPWRREVPLGRRTLGLEACPEVTEMIDALRGTTSPYRDSRVVSPPWATRMGRTVQAVPSSRSSSVKIRRLHSRRGDDFSVELPRPASRPMAAAFSESDI